MRKQPFTVSGSCPKQMEKYLFIKSIKSQKSESLCHVSYDALHPHLHPQPSPNMMEALLWAYATRKWSSLPAQLPVYDTFYSHEGEAVSTPHPP